MKYEDIKVGDKFRFKDYKETVIAKIDEYKAIVTADKNNHTTAWAENELKDFEPLKEELPEEGLLVSKSGSLVYKLSDGSGYGFVFGNQFAYCFDKGWEFNAKDRWKPATPKQEEKFIKMLKKECEKRGLFEDTKIEKDADGDSISFYNFVEFTPVFTLTGGYNKNGRIFHKGNFSTPRKEKSTLELVAKSVQEIGDFTIEQTELGIIILTPIKTEK